MSLNLNIEYYYKDLGLVVVGVDEAGRGSLIGSVVAAAVIIDLTKPFIEGIKDSKLISSKKRDVLYDKIIENHIYSIGFVSSKEIDEINIYQATKKACILAVDSLSHKKDIILVDGNMNFDDKKIKNIVKGDNICYSIAAASIIAKVTRDREMKILHNEFPEYEWNKNFGYATRQHMEAIKSYGLTIHHRKSFKCRNLF